MSKKAQKAKRTIEEDEGDSPISTSKPKPSENEDDGPFLSHPTKKKKKLKKNQIENSQKMKSKEEKEKGEEKEENEACYLPGQKHDRPKERDSLRIFFQTLHQQLPDCELATKWMMEWGLLPPEEAMDIYERLLEKNQQQERDSPGEAVSLKKTSKISGRKADKVSSNAVAKSKKRKVSVTENSLSDDLILSKKKKKKHEASSC